MATLRQDKRTRYWTVRIYWAGKQQQRSCSTKSKREATRTLSLIEDTLHLLKTGRLEIPPDINPLDWIVSGGKVLPVRSKQTCKDKRLGVVCAAYLNEQKQKQPTTLMGESVHIGHLSRLLTKSIAIDSIDLDKLAKYRRRRAQQKHHGRVISDATIKKELVTFRQIWVWAKQHNYISSPCPLLDENGRWRMTFEKPDSRGKFLTWNQIERRIARGGLSEEEVSTLWKGLFLDNEQVCELLQYVKSAARHSFIYPMFAFVAYTGVRRSEIVRSEIDDFDFSAEQILIRERKRRKDRRGSTRLIPLHPKLRQIMTEWFERHPGGRFTIAPPLTMLYRKKSAKPTDRLTLGQAHRHFQTTLKHSKWTVIRGFHVLLHSFGSNLVRTGKVPSDVVAKWMGHTTEEMRELYQHLFPQDGLE